MPLLMQHQLLQMPAAARPAVQGMQRVWLVPSLLLLLLPMWHAAAAAVVCGQVRCLRMGGSM
jgi:hypothetical protein